ncbi:hypothetical protein Cgig2_018975 [Carnegiea gigantea]|uniref:Uncharacterized protein n=1 Tax=Carnegiea gigantea TaxID=171969 RepID=A0A9Q1QAN7_9CARY|nr:hypothetical protein Cgig2_018975 [Carnegiea gigantea]
MDNFKLCNMIIEINPQNKKKILVLVVQKPVDIDTKHKKIFNNRKSPAGFVAMIDKFNEAQKQAIRDMSFGGFLELQVTKLPGDFCKWLLDNFDPNLVTLYVAAEKKIEIIPMDVHLTLAPPIGGRNVEEFLHMLGILNTNDGICLLFWRFLLMVTLCN